MKLHSSTKRIIFKELRRNAYGFKNIRHDTIMNMVDIGANVGIISILARLLNPRMNIVAVEPHIKTYEQLVSNVENLGIKTLNGALGNGETFYLTKQGKKDVCNKFSVKDEVKDDISLEVQSYRIQDIFKMYNFNPDNTLLKMDCEGAESFMVGDVESEKILRKTKIIIMEAHNSHKVKLDEFIDWFIKNMWATHNIIIDKGRKLVNLKAIEKEYFDFQYNK